VNSPRFLFAERHVAKETAVRLLDPAAALGFRRHRRRRLLLPLLLFLLQLFVPLLEKLLSKNFRRVADEMGLSVLLQTLVVGEHLVAERALDRLDAHRPLPIFEARRDAAAAGNGRSLDGERLTSGLEAGATLGGVAAVLFTLVVDDQRRNCRTVDVVN